MNDAESLRFHSVLFQHGTYDVLISEEHEISWFAFCGKVESDAFHGFKRGMVAPHHVQTYFHMQVLCEMAEKQIPNPCSVLRQLQDLE
jgi:hypothetical protein